MIDFSIIRFKSTKLKTQTFFLIMHNNFLDFLDREFVNRFIVVSLAWIQTQKELEKKIINTSMQIVQVHVEKGWKRVKGFVLQGDSHKKVQTYRCDFLV